MKKEFIELKNVLQGIDYPMSVYKESESKVDIEFYLEANPNSAFGD